MAKGAAVMTVSDQAFSEKLDRDHQRAVNHRHKWQYGQTTTRRGAGDKVKPVRRRDVATTTGGACSCCVRASGARPSPDPVWNDYGRQVQDRLHGYAVNKNTGDFPECDVHGDAVYRSISGYFYSYDQPTGPTEGAHVLGAAVDQAVARFENRVTETLVKNEYDVVDAAAASDAGIEHEQEDEEDFELV